MKWRLYLWAIAAVQLMDVEPALAQLSGHGGPVRALAILAGRGESAVRQFRYIRDSMVSRHGIPPNRSSGFTPMR